MLASQLSHTRSNMNQLVCNFKSPQASVSQMLIDFLPPFYHALKQKSLSVAVVEANLIP